MFSFKTKFGYGENPLDYIEAYYTFALHWRKPKSKVILSQIIKTVFSLDSESCIKISGIASNRYESILIHCSNFAVSRALEPLSFAPKSSFEFLFEFI
jgi:hypothetical protein